jgi:hypothetical protein
MGCDRMGWDGVLAHPRLEVSWEGGGEEVGGRAPAGGVADEVGSEGDGAVAADAQ